MVLVGFDPYLKDQLVSFSALILLVWSYASVSGRSRLRSADDNQLFVPRTQTGPRAFLHIWTWRLEHCRLSCVIHLRLWTVSSVHSRLFCLVRRLGFLSSRVPLWRFSLNVRFFEMSVYYYYYYYYYITKCRHVNPTTTESTSASYYSCFSITDSCHISDNDRHCRLIRGENYPRLWTIMLVAIRGKTLPPVARVNYRCTSTADG